MTSKSNKKGKYKKRNFKPTNTERLMESLGESGGKFNAKDRELSSKDNDWSWYANNPQLIKDVASYPFGKALGLNFGSQSYFQGQSVPAIMSYCFAPSIGVATKESDPINVAMRKLYSYVRHANSGARNYDAPDMMLYVVAVDSANMYLEWMKRLYGMMMNYTAFNRAYPRGLMIANGVSYPDMEIHLNDFRAFINIYAAKLNQLWIPADFSYIKRHAWMTSHYYVDSSASPKAQTYMYVPISFYKFTLAGNPIVGSLTLASPSSNATWGGTSYSGYEDLVNFGNSLLEPLITNEDIGIMSGDILKAYGAGGCLNVMGITEDYRVLPEYSEEVLSQFENATTFLNYNPSTFSVTQDTSIGGGYLKSAPHVYVGPKAAISVQPVAAAQQNVADAIAAPLKGKILNFHATDVSPELVMVATRLCPAIGNVSYTYTGAKQILADIALNSCGSEVIVKAYMYRNKDTNPNGYSQNQFSSATWGAALISTSNPDVTVTSSTFVAEIASWIANFDWHTGITVGSLLYTDDGEFTWSSCPLPLQDLDYWTELDEVNLSNMHTVALLSEFTVPQVG